MTTKEDDFVEDVIVSHSHAHLMFFTSKGRVYAKKAYRVPEAGRQAKGTNLVNIIELGEGENVTAIIPIVEFTEGEYLTMVTRRGVIKRTLLTDFAFQRQKGKKAINLDDDDELIFVKHTKGDENLIIATRDGMAVRFDEENVRSMGRTARGVRGITLSEGDSVVGVCVVDESKTLLTITEGGMGKRTSFDDFREMKHRGGRGVTCHKIGEKTGKLASVVTVSDGDDIMLITNDGTIIRTSVDSINVYSRTAAGVIVMRLGENSLIKKVARLEPQEEIDAESAAVEQTLDVVPAEIIPDEENEDVVESEE
jgi:DNA gyrase subunit A